MYIIGVDDRRPIVTMLKRILEKPFLPKSFYKE